MSEYDLVKKIFWPHIAIPFVLLMLLAYADIVTGMVRAAAIFWVVVQVLGLAVGMWTAAYASFGTKETLWSNIHRYQIVKVIPTIKVGMVLMEWALTETDPQPEPVDDNFDMNDADESNDEDEEQT